MLFLLKNLKRSPDNKLLKRVKNLTREKRNHLTETKRRKVRQRLVPGNSKSLWKAVYNAKDMDSGELPTTMFHEGNEISDEDLPDVFADLFKSKIDNI